ncbi:MAG: DinB family protein [Bacteroidales bacterium]|nr:MAG: DinB family protein [Bacteroidales bacterium]
MIIEFEQITKDILSILDKWEDKLSNLSDNIISEKRNNQNRTIKEILGHLIDSASNSTHRIVHLQNQASPLVFPNYATNGNNDRWIAIQNYQDESWSDIIMTWKYTNRHLAHVIKNVQANKLKNEWIASPNRNISLKEMVIGYLEHLKLHLNEIDDLINK